MALQNLGKGVTIERLIKHWQTSQPNSELSNSMVSKLRQYAMSKFLCNEADTVVIRNGEKVITNGIDKKIITEGGKTRYERVLENNRCGNSPEQPWYVSCISGIKDKCGYVAELFNGKVKKIDILGGWSPISGTELVFDKKLGTYVERENIPFKNLQAKVQKLFDKKCETAVKQVEISLDEYSRLVKQAKSEMLNNGFEDFVELRGL